MLPLCLRLGERSGTGLKGALADALQSENRFRRFSKAVKDFQPQNLRDFETENQNSKFCFAFVVVHSDGEKTSSKFHREVLYGCTSEPLGRNTRTNLPPASGLLAHT
jgi:hypothetical protein